ncbi:MULTISPECIES: tyrosine-protein phosphatase [Streptomyces]|uniref:tyrosine-protein phosphatase n=1 Tax=Streptomyces TaxID=1883 RepID=UPI0022AA84BC|nr:tyrosine-protein phosphatase [Streptomyces sp. HB2AG]MCZ2523726.1 tyrosine-protein phosphatase [Streptomyces sp. HB2AG]
MTQQTPETAPSGTLTTETLLTGVRNFRDVGGLPAADGRRVRHGRLYRSGHLAHATDEDAAFLASLNLHTVFDFRNAADIRLEGPDVLPEGVGYVNMPLSDPAQGAEFWRVVRNGDIRALREQLADGRAVRRMVTSYRHTILHRTAEHSRLLHALAENTLPALLHCAAGKDRAGLSVAVTLMAVGVDREAVEHDYLESNAVHRRYAVRRDDDAEPATTPEVMELLSPLFEARSEYLAEAFRTIDETWGTVDRYLGEGLGVAPATRELLRERLLTED